MSSTSTDRNLLFVVLALQSRLIDREQFIQACTLWATHKDVPIADLLVEQGWLTTAAQGLVEQLLALHLAQHGDDVGASLAAAAGAEARGALASIADPDVEQSLAALGGSADPPAAADPYVTVPPSEPEGAGRNILFEEIGHGGMGRVLRGRDNDLRRELAVKVLREEYSGNAEVERRFVEEAQIGGQLQHPGIVPVYELGRFPDGRPFFTMKLVKGRTLSDLLKERPDVSHARARFLTIFEQVCQTLAYAHSKGVIHRDLKPSNVMVGAFGEVQVMDWGLAKVLARPHRASVATTAADPSVLTAREDAMAEGGRTGVIGTPEFMPTELARGDGEAVDERADVFGLGGILCVILTGQPPFVAAEAKALHQEVAAGRMSREEARAQIVAALIRKAVAGDVAEAFARLDGCGADAELVTLCKECLAPGRQERPREAGEVAARMAAYQAAVQERLRQVELERAAAEARAEEAKATARAERQRRRVSVALALAVLFTAGGVGWALWDRAAQETARRVELAGRMAETDKVVAVALTKAQQSEERANRLPCTASAEAKASLVEWREAAASLAEAEAALTTGAATDGLREQVADMRQRVASGRTQAQRKERLFRDLDDARMALAKSRGWHLDKAGAAVEYAAAFAEFGLKLQQGQTEVVTQRICDEEPAIRDALIVALDNWWSCAEEPVRGNIMAVANAADQDAWRRDYRRAVENQDSVALLRLSKEARRLALPPVSLLLLARALSDNDQWAEARDLLHWARGLYPNDFWIATQLGYALEQATATVPVDLEERIGCHRVAVALRPDVSIAHTNLGHAFIEKNQLDDAIAECNKAIALDDKNAIAHNNLALALYTKNQMDNAIAEWNKTIALDPTFAKAHSNLASVLHAKNKLDDAIAECNKAIALDPNCAPAHNNLGLALWEEGRLDEAVVEFNKAIAIDPKDLKTQRNLNLCLLARKVIVTFNLTDASDHIDRGIALQRKNQLDDAIAEYKQAISLDPKRAEAHIYLGLALVDKNQLDEAIAEFKKAIDLDPKSPSPHYNLGNTLLRQSRFAQAEASFQRCLELRSASDPRREATERRIKQARRFLELDKKLPSILSGETKPTDTAECLDLVELCQIKQLNAAAARFSTLALADKPALADDLNKGYRYDAACFAALAAAGQGKDSDKLSDQARAELRKQALQWLRADLAAWGKQRKRPAAPVLKTRHFCVARIALM